MTMVGALAKLIGLVLVGLVHVHDRGGDLRRDQAAQRRARRTRRRTRWTSSRTSGRWSSTARRRAFRGGSVTTMFGGGELDLRDATLDPAGATIHVSTLFGGGSLIVPEGWNVETSMSGIGGVGDMRPKVEPPGGRADAARRGHELVRRLGNLLHADARRGRAAGARHRLIRAGQRAATVGSRSGTVRSPTGGQHVAMIRTTPFHARTSALNETGLWSHWSGHLATERYGLSDKFEYFAVRNAAGVFDTSPLFKYRIRGPDAERFLAGVLARDIRGRCGPGHAQYTIWCDDRGFVIEDGVVFRHAENEFLLTAAEPNLGYFQDLVGRLRPGRDRGRLGGLRRARRPGPARPADPRRASMPEVEAPAVLRASPSARSAGCPVTISRTGYTGDLGYEVCGQGRERAAACSTRSGRRPAGTACGRSARRRCTMTRIEAGLLLIDVEFASAGSPSPTTTASPPRSSASAGCSRASRPTTAPFIGRDAIRRELAGKTSRWADGRDRRRLARLGPAPPTRPACSRPRTSTRSPTSRCCTTTDGAAGRLRHELHVLARAPAPHRHGPGPPRARATPGSEVHLELADQPPQHHGRSRRPPGCPSSTPSERRPDDDPTTEHTRTTPSSSAAATTAWSTAPTSPRRACARSSSSGGTSSAAPRSPRSCCPGF